MKNHTFKKLITEQLSYLAGLLDGDGCVLVQIVRGSFKYKFSVTVSVVFYQKKPKRWFFIKLQELLGVGNIRIKNDGMLEYSIEGLNLVEKFLQMLFPYLILKKSAVILVFQIIKGLRSVRSKSDFIEVCKLVDKFAAHTYSKKRVITSLVVEKDLILPVETKN